MPSANGPAWSLDAKSPEVTGVFAEPLDFDLLPVRDGGYRHANADPITGQAAWYAFGCGSNGPPMTRPNGSAPRSRRQGGRPTCQRRPPALWRAVQESRRGRLMTIAPKRRTVNWVWSST